MFRGRDRSYNPIKIDPKFRIVPGMEASCPSHDRLCRRVLIIINGVLAERVFARRASVNYP